jgi:predicted ribosomally synthesized peptide with SipW-like signal peptide
MLAGSTYAWFTDSITSSGNIIQTGTLDIALEKWDTTTSAWVDASDKPIFNYAKWEPGYTQVVNLRVVNLGTLALKWSATITTEDELSALADVINVYVRSDDQNDTVKDYIANITDRSQFETLAARGQFKKFTLRQFVENLTLMTQGTLVPQQESYLGIVLQMDTEAGNEYQNLSLGGEFDLKIVASQYAYEEDSFDNTYDEITASSISRLEELKVAAKMGGEYWLSEDIVITADVATIIIENDLILHLNGYNIDASAHPSRPFEMANGVSFTINGEVYEGTDATFEGETVLVGNYGLVNIPSGYAATLTLNGGKYIGNTDNGAFIKVRGGSAETEIVLNNVWYNDHGDNENADKKGFVLSAENHTGTDFTLTVNGGYYKAPVGIAAPSATISNATIIATGEPNMNPAVYATKAGNVTLENCTIEATYHAVAVANKATITVNNCTVTADADHFAFQVNKSGGTIYVNNTTYTGKIGTTGKVSATALIYVDGELKYQKDPA